MRCTPVVGGHHEVEQQADGLLHVDLVGGGQPLVQLEVDGGQNGLQPGHAHVCAVLQRVEPAVTKRFDHVPHIDQVDCKERTAVRRRRARSAARREVLLLRLHLFCTKRSLQAVL